MVLPCLTSKGQNLNEISVYQSVMVTALIKLVDINIMNLPLFALSWF
jgi:hypothetical protein